MEEVDAEEVHRGEGLFDGPGEKLVNDADHLRGDFAAMVVLSSRQNLNHAFEHDEFLPLECVKLSIELEDLLFAAIKFDLLEKDSRAARNLAALRFGVLKELAHEVLIARSSCILCSVYVPCRVG